MSGQSFTAEVADITSRSRTGLFLSYRDSRARLVSRPRLSSYPESPYAAADDEHEGLIPASPAHTALDLDLPPKWSYFCPPLSSNLAELISLPGSISRTKYRTSWRTRGQKVRSRVLYSPLPFHPIRSPVTALEKLHAKHVLPGFTDRSLEEREIEAITTDITKVRQSSSGHLPSLSY
jgi:syntaxin 16